MPQDAPMSKDAVDSGLRGILADVLGLPADRVARFTAATGLFGHLSELDSMAVAGLLTEIEDRLGIVIDDDDIDGDMMATYGALLAYVRAKVASAGAAS